MKNQRVTAKTTPNKTNLYITTTYIKKLKQPLKLPNICKKIRQLIAAKSAKTQE